MIKLTPLYRLALAVALCLLPLVVLLIGQGLDGVDSTVVRHTIAGLPVALIGGFLAGAAAERFLHRSAGTIQTLLGLALTGGFGVLTIGYIYLLHIRGPMSTVGAFPRAVEQVTLFVAFLLAQIAGVLVAPLVLPSRPKKP